MHLPNSTFTLANCYCYTNSRSYKEEEDQTICSFYLLSKTKRILSSFWLR